jgi:hypothetical protein
MAFGSDIILVISSQVNLSHDIIHGIWQLSSATAPDRRVCDGYQIPSFSVNSIAGAMTRTVRFLLRGILRARAEVGSASPSNQLARMAAECAGLDTVDCVRGEERPEGAASGCSR